jgi:hypothetical protein
MAASALQSASDFIEEQKAERAAVEQRALRSSLGGITWTVLLEDAGEAIRGIPADLWGSTRDRASLADVFMHGDRLRGIGVLLVALALAWFVVSRAADAVGA